MYSQAASVTLLSTHYCPSQATSSLISMQRLKPIEKYIDVNSHNTRQTLAKESRGEKRNIYLKNDKDLQAISLTDDEKNNLREYRDLLRKECMDSPLSSFTLLRTRNQLLPERLRKLVLRLILDREASKLPSEMELQKLSECLTNSTLVKTEISEGQSQRTILLHDFIEVLKEAPTHFTNIVEPISFFRAYFPEWASSQSECRINVDSLIELVSLKIAFMRNRINMTWYDSNGTGYLTKDQLCDYYRREVMQMVEVLKDLEDTFRICYMNTVESMFFFFLDFKHTCRIRIVDALMSGFIENAFALQTNPEDYENWFSPEKTHELNAMFQVYDSKQKNYLSRSDFKQILDGTFTRTFVDRLFESHVAKRGEQMSYEEFVTFQIAYNHLAHPASTSYFFKVLDVDGNGYLSRFELRFFYTELRDSYNAWFMENAMPEFDDFANQFFDMVKPIDSGKISLRELVACKQGHDFILCLSSYQEFYRYETRDSEGGAADQDSEIPSTFDDMLNDDAMDALEYDENNNDVEDAHSN